MNTPVHEAIDALQQSISTLQSTMLQNDLIKSAAVIRTIRASSSLEDAQQAWSRFLNLPGRVSSPTRGAGDSGDAGVEKREPNLTRLPPTKGRYYAHNELWGRDGQKGRLAETARVGRLFVV